MASTWRHAIVARTPSTRPPPRRRADDVEERDADARTVRRKKYLGTDLPEAVGDGPCPKVRRTRRPRRARGRRAEHRYNSLADIRDVGAARFLFIDAQLGEGSLDATRVPS